MAADNVTNLDLAKAIGVNHRAVGRWRSGQAEITWQNLQKVAEHLQREPAWFYSDERAAA